MFGKLEHRKVEQGKVTRGNMQHKVKYSSSFILHMYIRLHYQSQHFGKYQVTQETNEHTPDTSV